MENGISDTVPRLVIFSTPTFLYKTRPPENSNFYVINQCLSNSVSLPYIFISYAVHSNIYILLLKNTILHTTILFSTFLRHIHPQPYNSTSQTEFSQNFLLHENDYEVNLKKTVKLNIYK